MRHYLLSACLVLSIACQVKTSAENYLQEASVLEEKGKYLEAIKLLDKAIEKDPKYVGAYINRGADRSSLADYRGAIDDYQRVLAIDPGNMMALLNIGNNYKRLQQYKKAVHFYDIALRSNEGQGIRIVYTPNKTAEQRAFDVPWHEINYERGIAYYYLDSLNKAFTDFQYAIAKDFMKAECYAWVGYIYISSGKKDEGCSYLQKAKMEGNKEVDSAISKYCQSPIKTQ